jgi:hypothetical protein
MYSKLSGNTAELQKIIPSAPQIQQNYFQEPIQYTSFAPPSPPLSTVDMYNLQKEQQLRRNHEKNMRRFHNIILIIFVICMLFAPLIVYNKTQDIFTTSIMFLASSIIIGAIVMYIKNNPFDFSKGIYIKTRAIETMYV